VSVVYELGKRPTLNLCVREINMREERGREGERYEMQCPCWAQMPDLSKRKTICDSLPFSIGLLEQTQLPEKASFKCGSKTLSDDGPC
jgi:hypothetical protein